MTILCDTDFLLASLIVHESTHEKAVLIQKAIKNADLLFLDLVHFEIATVMSRKYGSREAKMVLDSISNLDISRVSFRDYESEIWTEFRSHTKKNVSFVDCANLVVARKMKARIASFDVFYPRYIRIAP